MTIDLTTDAILAQADELGLRVALRRDPLQSWQSQATLWTAQLSVDRDGTSISTTKFAPTGQEALASAWVGFHNILRAGMPRAALGKPVEAKALPAGPDTFDDITF